MGSTKWIAKRSENFFFTCTKHAQTFLPSCPSLNTKYQTIHRTFALTLHCVRFLPSRDDCKNRRGFVCCADSTLFPIRDLNIHLATMGVLEPMSPVSQRETILTLQFWVCVCVGGGIHTSSVISRWWSRFPASSSYLLSRISNFLAFLWFSKAFISLSCGSFQRLLSAKDPRPGGRGYILPSSSLPSVCQPVGGVCLQPEGPSAHTAAGLWQRCANKRRKQKLSCSHFKLH